MPYPICGTFPNDPACDSCYSYLVDPGNFFVLFHDFSQGLGTRTVTLRDGESLILRGLIGEMDVVALNCGQAPYYIPAWLNDFEGRVGPFNQVFTYDELVDGGGAGQLSASLQTSECDFSLQYSLTVE